MEKDIRNHKDHIIIPKATLIRFADDKSKKIYFLNLSDVDNISINEIFPKSYNVMPNYYNPECDDKVKRFETDMGKLYREISDALNVGRTIIKDKDAFKKQIIDFITIEFYRMVIADDFLLGKYKTKQQQENDCVDAALFKTGNMTVERNNYSINYRKQAKTINSFRYYAQNILGTDNRLIINMYQNFTPHILFIPKNSDYHFMLPHSHFICNECFALFILAPDIALALYPAPISSSLLVEADSERVKIINLRVLESISFFSLKYKEIVGDKEQLEKTKEQIDLIRDIYKRSKDEVIIDEDQRICIHDINDVLEFAIILFLIMGEPDEVLKVTMNVHNFDDEFLHNNKNEILNLFLKYKFDLNL